MLFSLSTMAAVSSTIPSAPALPLLELDRLLGEIAGHSNDVTTARDAFIRSCQSLLNVLRPWAGFRVERWTAHFPMDDPHELAGGVDEMKGLAQALESIDAKLAVAATMSPPVLERSFAWELRDTLARAHANLVDVRAVLCVALGRTQPTAPSPRGEALIAMLAARRHGTADALDADVRLAKIHREWSEALRRLAQ